MLSYQSKQVSLSDIVAMSIQTGFQIRGRVQAHPQGNYSLIQVKDTYRGTLYHIRSEALDKVFIPEKKNKFMNKYLIQKNDVLYLSKLNPGAFRYMGSFEKTIPMAHFYILRPKTEYIDSDYLCWALNQDFMKPQIQKYLKGTILPFISKDALAAFRIPLPNINIQKKIINLLQLRVQEKEIQEAIDKKKNTLMNKILTELL